MDLAQLSNEKDKLIQQLKNKYPKLYNWLVENEYDLNDLTKHAATITAAFILTMNVNAKEVDPEIMQRHQQARKLDELKSSNPSTADLKAINVVENYGEYIEETSQKYDIDPNVIFATIMVESMGNPNATRYEPHINDSSYGLGQLLYGTSRYLGYDGAPQGLMDPKTNIDLIGKYHRRTLDVYGQDLNYKQLATAYNAGNPYGTPIYGHVDKFDGWYKKGGEFLL